MELSEGRKGIKEWEARISIDSNQKLQSIDLEDLSYLVFL